MLYMDLVFGIFFRGSDPFCEKLESTLLCVYPQDFKSCARLKVEQKAPGLVFRREQGLIFLT